MLATASFFKAAGLRRAALLALIVCGFCCGQGDDMTDRVYPVRDYASFFYAGQKSFAVSEAETFDVALKVKNAGRAVWSSTDNPPCLLSYHLLNDQKKIIRRDNARFPLPRPVKPGESFPATVKVKAPLEAGRYVLEFDMVREGVAWFKELGSRTIFINLKVAPRVWPEDRRPLNLEEGPFTRFETSRPAFNTLLKLIRLTLGQNEISFKGITGKVTGFRAGASYPQVWLRDANTVIPASRYFFGRDHLRSWLIEFLARQNADGSLEDWVDASGETSKNTTETDQEASAVQAAAQVCRLEGTDWLVDKASGRPIIDRLENALHYVLADRLDEKTGLVKSAHTIDWGDVDIEDGDERAVKVDERTRWVAGIYSQSMFYGAARDLAWMFGRMGQKEKSLFWTIKAQSLKNNTDRRLWQEDKGFYRVHLHLDATMPHGFDENDMFAMGGNVTAVHIGLADETKSTRILKQAMLRQKAYGLSTASGVLLPPYPRGVFRHPLVDDPYEYQNGGQWDWFGGLLVLALFENGFSRQAADKLMEIASKNISNGGLYEWDDKQGTGRGSDFYCGSAGSLGRALFEGYFGINLTADSLSLEPRLGTDKARIHAYLPGAGLFVAYDHRLTADGRTLIFEFNSNFRGRGRLCLRLPWPSRARDSLEITSSDYEVTLDGQPVPFAQSRVNEDEYIDLETDFGNRRLEVRPNTPGRARPRR
jgi:hypothetical protein